MDAASAVLDVLVKLDFGHSRTGLKRQLELVRSHMRLLHCAPQHREFAYSGYPSEPVLAEAAAQRLAKWMDKPSSEESPPISLARILLANINAGTPGILDPGQRGEVVARILIMTAYIKAVRRESKDARESPGTGFPLFTKGCSLTTFFGELFTEKYATEVLDSFPPRLTEENKLRNTFKNSVVRITHFVLAGDNGVITLPAVKAAFIRGMVIIGHSTQAHVDLIIPILLDRNKPLTDDNISAIMWQVKRRHKLSTRNSVIFDARDIYFFPKSHAKKEETPYITIISELGLYAANHNYVPPLVLVLTKRGSKEQPEASSDRQIDTGDTPSKAQLGQHRNKDLWNFTIFAEGCSPTIYKVIDETERSIFATLLSSKPLFYDHPRPNTMSAIHAMKPVWYVDYSFKDWIEGPFEALGNRLFSDEISGQEQKQGVEERVTAGSEIGDIQEPY